MTDKRNNVRSTFCVAYGNVLLQMLKKRKKNRVWLAEAIGASPATISRYTGGRTIADSLTTSLIAQACGVTVDAFMKAVTQETMRITAMQKVSERFLVQIP